MRYFRKRMRSARFVLVSGAVGIVVLAGAAVATASLVGYPQDSVTVETGCLTTSGTGSGNIVNVAMGTNPAKSCGSNQKTVHLSGGTITQVTGGTGLTTSGSGGTDTGGSPNSINNGFAKLGLLPGFALPQNCSPGQFPDWGGVSGTWGCGTDQNTTYSNGTGLDLSGTTFSINSNYQLPQNCTSGQFPSSNGAGSGFGCGTDKTYSGKDFATSGQSCPVGQFVTGIDGNGALTCARPCIVVNATTDKPYLTLQAADTDATAGDTLLVNGTCVGNTTIDKNLTITGHGSAILDGGGSGSVLTIGNGVTASVNTLTISDGGGSFCAINTSLLRGGGICNLGTLTLNNSTVSNNSADEGGGIWNYYFTDSVTLNDSTVSHNSATTREGGGIWNYVGTLTVNGTSSIDHNSAAANGGGIESLSGVGGVTLNGSSTVSNNSAENGGGIDSLVTVMNGTSTISGNSASGSGGGAYVGIGNTLTMNGSSTIHDNSATGPLDGGGIFLEQSPSNPSPPNGTAPGAVAATTCPPSGSENVYCNTPDQIITGP